MSTNYLHDEPFIQKLWNLRFEHNAAGYAKPIPIKLKLARQALEYVVWEMKRGAGTLDCLIIHSFNVLLAKSDNERSKLNFGNSRIVDHM